LVTVAYEDVKVSLVAGGSMTRTSMWTWSFSYSLSGAVRFWITWYSPGSTAYETFTTSSPA